MKTKKIPKQNKNFNAPTLCIGRTNNANYKMTYLD